MTISPPEGWRLDLLPPDRQQLLSANQSFEQLAEKIASKAGVISASIEPCRTPPPSAPRMAQVVFRITVERDELDRFHNGLDGLRARYWSSPQAGDRATRLLIDLLEPTLLATPVTAFAKKAWPMNQGDVQASLRKPSAKAWVTESEEGKSLIDANNTCRLSVHRWEENEHLQPEKRLWRWTPDHGCLDIKGALITRDHVEFVPESKRDRAIQIHRFGWT